MYKDANGGRVFTDRIRHESEALVYLGRYGRPTATASCRGVTNAAIEFRGAQYELLIAEQAEEHGIPAALIKAVMRVESCFDSRAESRVGARGLMQLMPATARELGVSDRFNPGENLRGGARYLARMLREFKGDMELALAAYNAGPGRVRQYGGVPPFRETKNYIRRVTRQYQRYLDV